MALLTCFSALVYVDLCSLYRGFICGPLSLSLHPSFPSNLRTCPKCYTSTPNATTDTRSLSFPCEGKVLNMIFGLWDFSDTSVHLSPGKMFCYNV